VGAHALSTTPSAIAQHNLRVFILGRGERADAVGHFRRAVAIKPGLREAQSNLDQMLAGSSQSARLTPAITSA
jgi:hypothetical protein